jgi:hypothetical protein
MQDVQTSACGVPVSTGRRLRLALILFLTLPLYTTSRAKAPKLAQDPHLLCLHAAGGGRNALAWTKATMRRTGLSCWHVVRQEVDPLLVAVALDMTLGNCPDESSMAEAAFYPSAYIPSKVVKSHPMSGWGRKKTTLRESCVHKVLNEVYL